MFARPVEAICGMKAETLFSPDRGSAFSKQWERARQGAPVQGFSCEIRRADGEVSAVEMSLLPTETGVGPHVQISLQSLAAIKTAEAQAEETAVALAKERRAQAALVSILRVINEGLDTAAMARSCLTSAAKATGAQLGFIYTSESDNAGAEPLSSYLPGDQAGSEESLSYARDLASQVVKERRPVIPARIPDDASLLIRTGSWKRKPGGVAAHPLLFRDKMLGVLVLAGLRAFPPEDIQLMQLLSDQIALVFSQERIITKSNLMAEELSSKERLLQGHDDELLRKSEELFNQDLELLEKDERLKGVEKLKHDFLEKMSRELRTPLNLMIHHLIGALSNEDEDSISAESLAHLRAALGEGSAFSRTLNNIVDLWRIKERQLRTDAKLVHFDAVIDEAIHHVQQLAVERNVKIEKDLEGATEPVRTDLAKLTQVMTEVIGNAVKFTSQGTVAITAEKTHGGLVCQVADTGIGIASDDLKKVFEEFFQVDESATSGFRGAGLGLSVAEKLMELLGGSIDVTSEIGRGTTVTVTVRSSEPAEEEEGSG
jgi:signal transduction histidine kinase